MSANTAHDPIDVLEFWWKAGPEKWFAGGETFDDACRRFRPVYEAAAAGSLDDWAHAPHGALALVILTDQFPRNIFRGSGHAFATDPLALHYARRIVADGMDLRIAADLRVFAYLPFEHSEALADQHRSVALFEAMGDEGYLGYARAHLEVIERFGRFPHRNRALGRDSTPDEQSWLDAGGGF